MQCYLAVILFSAVFEKIKSPTPHSDSGHYIDVIDTRRVAKSRGLEEGGGGNPIGEHNVAWLF